VLQALPPDIEQAINFDYQIKKAFRILLNGSLCAQRHPGFGDRQVPVR
jgi:hypothetical protein